MGLSGISLGSLLLIFGIVILLFGTKKLRSLGHDLGLAVNGFRQALKQESETPKNDTDTTEIKKTALERNGADNIHSKGSNTQHD